MTEQTPMQRMLMRYMQSVRRDANECRSDRLGPNVDYKNLELTFLNGMRYASSSLEPLRYRVEDDAFLAAKHEINFLLGKYQETKK